MLAWAIDHEVGDLSEYSSTVNTGNLSVVSASMSGAYALRVNVDAALAESSATGDFVGRLENVGWAARVLVDVDGLTIASGTEFAWLALKDSGSNRLYSFIGRDGNGVYVRSLMYDDGGIWNHPRVYLSAGVNRIEWRNVRASSASASDGAFEVYKDGVLQTSSTGRDLYSKSPPNQLVWGTGLAGSLDSGTSGYIVLDGFAITDDATLPGAPSGGMITARVTANTQNCRDLRNESDAFSNSLFGFGSWWGSGGLSFVVPAVPSGATVHRAYISFRSQSVDGAFQANIYAENVDNGDTFASAPASFPVTTAVTNWSGNISAANTWYESPDVSGPVQEVISRSGWTAGNNLSFEIDPVSGFVNPFSYSDSPTYAAALVVEFSAPTGGGVNGQLASTLGDATTTAQGAVEISGQLSTILSSVGATAQGAVDVSGVASMQLAAATVASGGAVDISGATAAQLSDVTLAAAGTVLSGAITGQLAVALDDATSSSSGAVAIDGQATIALADAATIAQGAVAIDGQATIALADATATAQGGGSIDGQAAIALASATTTAQGAVSIDGQAALALSDATATAQGSVSIDGQATIALSDATLSAAGTALSGVVGQLTATLDDAAVLSVAAVAIDGQAAIALTDASVASIGDVEVSGQVAAPLQAAALTATADAAIAGQAAIPLDDASAASLGVVVIVGSLAVLLEDAGLSASTAEMFKYAASVVLRLHAAADVRIRTIATANAAIRVTATGDVEL